MKTIGISEQTHKALINLKLEEKSKNIENLIKELIIEYKKGKFLEAGNLFNLKLNENKIPFSKLLKKSKAIKEEIANEWF